MPLAWVITTLMTDSSTMLNNAGDKASPYLRPIVAGNSSDNSSPKLTLLFELYVHAFITLINLASIPNWHMTSQNFSRLIESYAVLKSTNKRCISLSNS